MAGELTTRGLSRGLGIVLGQGGGTIPANALTNKTGSLVLTNKAGTLILTRKAA